MKNVVLLVVLLLTLAGCRETIIAPSPQQLPNSVTGTVRDRFGNPAAGVFIRLYFDYILVSQTPLPVRAWTVPDSLTTVRVVVVDVDSREVYELFHGTRSSGEYLALWDGRDSAGVRFPSGIYTVRYMIGDSVCHSYTIATEGGIVARTDSAGVFDIDPATIPIGAYPVPIFSNDGRYFYGNHRIGNTVGLLFSSDVASVFVEVPLTPGNGRNVDLILE